MVNYQNGKVYKIINENNEIIYIGSTAEEKLCKRYAKHKLKAPNHKIILIENYSCNSKEELRKREQEIIEEHNNLLNKQRAYNSEEDKKQYDKKYSKEYREDNKDYYKEYHKKYYEENKKYYENNKIEILEKAKQKVNCPHCNCEIQQGNLKRHQKRNICLKFQKS